MRWVGLRGAGLLALLVPDNINERTTTDEDVQDHPDLDGQVVRAPGSRSGTVRITQAGEGGGPARTLAELSMDPDGNLREGGWQGAVLGHVDLGAGTITLTPDGEAFLQRKAGEAGVTLAPPAAGQNGAVLPDGVPVQPGQAPAEVPAPPAPGTPPQPAPPLVVPDAGFEHDPNDPDEADLVARMRGRPGTEIQNALNELRARKGERGTTKGTGEGGVSGVGGAVPGQGLPVNATGRRRPAAPVPNASPPAERHYLNRIKLNSQPKAKNTIILPGTDIQPDVQVIREGQAMRDGPYYVVGERYYEMHEGGRLYPVQGPGFVLLDRGAFRALCILNSLGDTPAAELMLDRQGIGEEQRRAARNVRGQR